MIRPRKHAWRVALCVLAVWLLHGGAVVAVNHSIRPSPNYDRCGDCGRPVFQVMTNSSLARVMPT